MTSGSVRVDSQKSVMSPLRSTRLIVLDRKTGGLHGPENLQKISERGSTLDFGEFGGTAKLVLAQHVTQSILLMWNIEGFSFNF